MRVIFFIPGPLWPMTGGRSQVEVKTSGRTLRDALEALSAAHPGIRDRILTEKGEIRQHVNVFVGQNESRLTGGLATPLTDGVEISIIPAISGGCEAAANSTKSPLRNCAFGRWIPPSPSEGQSDE
jgi:molybdopterin converting factor small subunit